MKKLLLVLWVLCLSVAGWAQPNKLPAVAKAVLKSGGKAAAAANVSSKIYRANYVLTSQSLSALTQIYAQQVAQTLIDPALKQAVRMQVLEQLKAQSAENLAALNAQLSKEYAQWADVLLRERNPKFLPKKDSSIPGVLAVSPDPKKYPHMTLRFYREWIDTIPKIGELPEEFTGLINALGKRLETIEVEMNYQYTQLTTAKKQLAGQDDVEIKRFYRKQLMSASRRLVSLSKEAGQCLADMVSLLNLYPSVFRDSLLLLAAKIDNSLQTEFNDYLRARINIPSQRAPTVKNRPMGFIPPTQQKTPDIPHGTTFTGYK